MNLAPIQKHSITDDIMNKIIEFILHGELHAGDKLPSEREMAEQLGVSRPSVREALRMLATRNIVEMRHGSGTFVTSLQPALLLEPLDFFLAMSDANIGHLFESRKTLECALAAFAAQRVTDEEIIYMDECVARTRAAVDDSAEFLRADLDLHNAIMRAARNPMLERMMMSISTLSQESRQKTVSLPGMKTSSPDDHQAIVDALRARDPELSQRMMRSHLDNIETALAKGVQG